jgi:hypothetical protein
MTTSCVRTLARCTAVLLLAAVLGSWLVVTDMGISGAEGAANSSGIEYSAGPLTLSPREGPPGARFTVKGRANKTCPVNACPTVRIYWRVRVSADANSKGDDAFEKVGTPVTMQPDGTFFVPDAKVPGDAVPGQHFVTAESPSGDAVFGYGDFTVSSPVPALTLSPATGPPGTRVHVQGSGYGPCTGTCQVKILWDATHELCTAVIDPNGAFATDFSAPPSATPGNHQVTGQSGSKSISATFAVSPPATTPSATTPPVESTASPTDPFFRQPDPPAGQAPPLPAGQAPPLPAGQAPPLPAGQAPPLPAGQVPPPGPGQPRPSHGSLKRAYLTTEVPHPTRVFSDPVQLLLGVLLAVVLVLVIAFPAEPFNSTFEENREKIYSWFSKIIRKLPRPNLPSWAHLEILGVVAAPLLLMTAVPLDQISLDEATLTQAVGYVLAIPLTSVILEVPGRRYFAWKCRRLGESYQRKDHKPQRKEHKPQWRVVPPALIVAVLLAALSRLADFDPPYVYGLIVVYVGGNHALKNVSAQKEKAETGRGTLIGVLCLFVSSVISWLVWTRLDGAFHHGLQGFGWLLLDAFLATFFLAGLEAVVFGMLPLTFLKGKEVWGWSKAVWAGTFILIVFIFVEIEFTVKHAKELTPMEVFKAGALFVIFGVSSMAFWAYFRYAPSHRASLTNPARSSR